MLLSKIQYWLSPHVKREVQARAARGMMVVFRIVLYVLPCSVGMHPRPLFSAEAFMRQIICYSSRAESRTGMVSQYPVPERNGPDLTA